MQARTEKAKAHNSTVKTFVEKRTPKANKAQTRAVELELNDIDCVLKWNPDKITSFYDWDNTGNWKENGYTEYTYNADGEVASETEYYYDEYEGKYITSRKYVYTYDPQVPGLVIKREAYNWDGTQLVPSEYETEEWKITRNTAGLIVSAVESYGGNYFNKMEIEYGKDNMPVKITLSDEDGIDGVYTDMVWNRFNGKTFLLFDDMDDLIDMIPGENSIKSCKYSDEDLEETLNVTFTDKGFTYVYKEVEKYDDDADTSEETATIEYTDENGSFKVESVEKSWENENPSDVETETLKGEVVFEKYGLCTYMKSVETSQNYTDTKEDKYTVVYDETTGLPAQYVGRDRKYVFTNGATGAVDSILAPDANAPVEYFDLNGRRVEDPSNGLYIRRQGSKASKIIVK